MEKIKTLIKEAITNREKKTTEEIKTDKSRSKKLWEHVKKLKGEKVTEKQPVTLFDENGEVIKEEEIPELMHSTWKKIYKTHETNIHEIWNETGKENYQIKVNENKNKQENPRKEHLDLAMKPQTKIMQNMKHPEIKAEDIQKQLKKF